MPLGRPFETFLKIEWMYDHTGDISLTSIHCVFSNEFENCPDEKM